MQIVIDIPQEKYDAIKSNYNTFPAEMKEWGLEAIKNGIVLPKGHGDLIDRNDLKYEKYNSYAYAIANAPTIIEADKESEG